jgi:thiamine kinase-like enzyme
MELILNEQNVVEYLFKEGICEKPELDTSTVESKLNKNSNFLVNLSDNCKLLVKQKRSDYGIKNNNDWLNELKIQDFIQEFSSLSPIQALLPKILHLNSNNSIIIVDYLNEYLSLTDFYTKENVFPIVIATSIGSILGEIHQQTFNRKEYQEFFSQAGKALPINNALKTFQELKQIDPEVLSLFAIEGLKFFVLYQRYEVLGKAINELASAFNPCCLTHKDLELKNILLPINWEQSLVQKQFATDPTIRLIDWKYSGWGDPAFDLGMLITSYLKFWLHSLIFDEEMTIEDSLRLAAIPLEKLQPSITALTKAYLDSFSEILEYRPDFLQRVVQYSGLGLIHEIQAIIRFQKIFGNTSIYMLQVAKSLLCRPEQSMSTVFGEAAMKITQIHSSAV